MIRIRLSYIITFSFLLFLVPEFAHSQMIKEFHRNKNDYFLDITAVFQNTSNKTRLAEGEALMETFSANWESSYFKAHQREKIYDISNVMLGKTMRAYPHFYNLISCLNLFVESNQSDESFECWLTELDTLGTQRSSNPMSDFLEYTYELFSNSILYSTNSRAWYFRNGSFSIEYDSVLYLHFDELDLICSTGRDSMEIIKTKGRYYPSLNYWSGSLGTISWRRAGFDADQVYAELKKYDIDVQTLSFESDSAVFYNKMYFDFPILGQITEKVLSSPPGNRASYPQFTSYFKDYAVLGIFENINFHGGVSMFGRKLLCVGDGDRPASFVFKKGGDYFALIRSRVFEVEGEEIMSSPASFAIYFDKDSIYHPGLQMKYNNENKLLSLIRLNRGIAQSPFFDAYHKVDMYCEALYWVMNSEELSFDMIKGISQESKAEFESDQYYSSREYYKLQGIDDVNPLVTIKKYADLYNTRIVKIHSLADFINKPVEQAVSMLLMLDSKGFVVYDSDDKEALIKNRLYDYLEAHAGNIDYDVIHFSSLTNNKSNAVVELASFDMLISGVPEISLSDSQSVYIYPSREEIIMKRNRDFSFSGRVRAGLFEFYARESSFVYDTFMINMPLIDSMSFFVKVPDTSGQEPINKYYRVQAVVEKMNGYLLIDRPGNKSGLKSYPQYPLFTSIDNSFVYYDDIDNSGGIFNQEEFYYELDPFTLDSLDNFSTSGLRFDGYFASGGILPPLKDPLVVMPDYSLGLNSFVDDEGLPVYDGKANFFDTIMIDNSGLHGAGRLEYLTSVTHSSNMAFFPDSVVSTTNSFKINKLLDNVEYADVSVGKASQMWYPDSNLMVVAMLDDAFDMYDSTSKMQGSLYLSPTGLNGSGDFTFERAVIESDHFVFAHHGMRADKSDFSLYTDTSFTELAFFTNDYRTKLDFDQRNGMFQSAGVSSLIEIPFNKFICYMDEIEWQMDDQIMQLKNSIAEDIPDINDMSMSELIDLDLSGSEFISTRPDHDSLRFFSTLANYDLRKNIIYAEDVKIIRVADAAIFPGDGKLNILKDAQIETLRFADIIADTATKYHHIYNATLDIFSSHNYIGNGDIDYVDMNGDADQIYLSSIGVDSTGSTHAFGTISDTAGFSLSPYYAFEGDVRLESREQYLHFDGAFSIKQDCFIANLNQALIDTLVNPNDIQIPVPDTLYSPDSVVVWSSLAYSVYDENFYPAFMSAPDREGDIAVLSAKGTLSYEAEEEVYTVSDKGAGGSGSYLSLHNDMCMLEGIGPINMSMELPHVELDLFGQAKHYIIPDSTTFDLVMGFDFFFDPGVLRRFTRDLTDANTPGTETSDPKFMTFLKEKIPSGGADKIISDLGTFGTIRRLPEGINYTLFLNHVSFKWSASTASLVSYGDIGIFSVGEEVVNRMVPGYVEIEKKANGYGEISLYFEIPEGDWYYFNYRNYILQVISSDEGFNTEILNLKPEKRIIYDKDEEVPYEFVISSRRKMIDFKRKMEEINGIGTR